MKRSERRLGIEFELTGLQTECPRPEGGRLGQYFRWHSDGSIDSIFTSREELCPHCEQLHFTESPLNTGELVINPPQNESFYMEGEELVKILEWLKTENPYLSASPEKKCSAHIHISVSESELVDIARYAKEHEDEAFEKWQPLQCRVDYCKKLHSSRSAEWLANQQEDRYRWINLACAYERHNTVEFRIFNGTTDIEEVRERVKWCLDFIDNAVGEVQETIVETETIVTPADIVAYHTDITVPVSPRRRGRMTGVSVGYSSVTPEGLLEITPTYEPVYEFVRSSARCADDPFSGDE